jgi:hypothetical protein
VTPVSIGAGGITRATSPDGTVTVEVQMGDPEYGLAAPLLSDTVTTPAKLQSSIQHQRAVTGIGPTRVVTDTMLRCTGGLPWYPLRERRRNWQTRPG